MYYKLARLYLSGHDDMKFVEVGFGKILTN
jgi:hypothetical protein